MALSLTDTAKLYNKALNNKTFRTRLLVAAQDYAHTIIDANPANVNGHAKLLEKSNVIASETDQNSQTARDLVLSAARLLAKTNLLDGADLDAVNLNELLGDEAIQNNIGDVFTDYAKVTFNDLQ